MRTIVATATTVAGAMATHSINVTVVSTVTSAPSLSVAPRSGVAPLTVTFTPSGIVPVSVAIDLDGDGATDFSGPTIVGQSFTYAQPGLYFPRVTITDAQGNQTTVTTIVHVEAPAVVQARFAVAWGTFKARLQAGDIPGALDYLTPNIQSRFQAIFQDLGADLPLIAAQLEDLVVLEQLEDLAETMIIRQDGGRPRGFFIYFRRSTAGRWLIEEM